MVVKNILHLEKIVLLKICGFNFNNKLLSEFDTYIAKFLLNKDCQDKNKSKLWYILFDMLSAV